MAVETIRGVAVGRRVSNFGDVDGVVLHLQGACGGGEIAENAFVFVDLSWEGHARARYLSWVNLHDIEHAALREPGRWALSQPAVTEVHSADWRPFGWGAPPFPNVAHVDLASETPGRQRRQA
jgi:hypothetical protein